MLKNFRLYRNDLTILLASLRLVRIESPKSNPGKLFSSRKENTLTV